MHKHNEVMLEFCLKYDVDYITDLSDRVCAQLYKPSEKLNWSALYCHPVHN